MRINVEIAKDYPKWNEQKGVNVRQFQTIAKNILSRYQNLRLVKCFELSVLLTDDKRIETLNAEFRQKKYATNVLSFPHIELNWRNSLEFRPDLDYMYLGDIAFSYDTIYRESLEMNKSFLAHFTHLLVHSILHLLGYDHVQERDAEAMEMLEIKILNDFGIASPY